MLDDTPRGTAAAPLPVVVDLTRTSTDLGTLGVVLDALARDLRARWSDALAEGDFATIDRLVEASHAVHRAAVALTEESFVPSATP
jgi:hypothetical protein